VAFNLDRLKSNLGKGRAKGTREKLRERRGSKKTEPHYKRLELDTIVRRTVELEHRKEKEKSGRERTPERLAESPLDP